jgi:hypothetical protein
MNPRPLLLRTLDGWCNHHALHAHPGFDTRDDRLRRLRNQAWNVGFLIVQCLALAAYAGPSHRGVLALALAIGVYGWVDLSLCTVRKAFLLHLERLSGGPVASADRIGSAWMMFLSLTVAYANLYAFCHLVLSPAPFNLPLGPVAALALSASTITTVGYGVYAPVGLLPVVLALMEAMTGIALVSCVIAGAIGAALGAPAADGAPAPATVAAWRPWPSLLILAGAMAVGGWMLP